MSQALLAIASLLLGVALNELIRKNNRIESYAPAIFQKRLGIYEALWEKLKQGREVAQSVIEDTNLEAEQRHKYISEVVMDIAEFGDENDLYLNEELDVHVCTLFMGVEDIQAEQDDVARQNLISNFNENFHAARAMIRAEMGLKQMDKLFQSVTKAKHSSSVIDYYREAKAIRAHSGAE